MSIGLTGSLLYTMLIAFTQTVSGGGNCQERLDAIVQLPFCLVSEHMSLIFDELCNHRTGEESFCFLHRLP